MLYYALDLQGGEEEEKLELLAKEKAKEKKTKMNDPIFFRYG
jgi:hypothetical protein